MALHVSLKNTINQNLNQANTAIYVSDADVTNGLKFKHMFNCRQCFAPNSDSCTLILLLPLPAAFSYDTNPFPPLETTLSFSPISSKLLTFHFHLLHFFTFRFEHFPRRHHHPPSKHETLQRMHWLTDATPNILALVHCAEFSTRAYSSPACGKPTITNPSRSQQITSLFCSNTRVASQPFSFFCCGFARVGP